MNHTKLSYFRKNIPPGRWQDWFLKGGKLKVRRGRQHSVAIQQNIPDHIFLDGGASHIYVKRGNTQGYSDRVGTPVKNISTFMDNPDGLMNFSPFEKTPAWSRQKCRDFVKFEYDTKGGFADIEVWASESYSASFEWRLMPDNANQQLIWICEAMGEYQDPKGAWFFPDYGTFDLQYNIDTSDYAGIRIALESPENALAWMKQHEGAINYFGNELWRYSDCLVSTYWLNRRNDYEWCFKVWLQLKLCRLAMSAPGVTRKRRIAAYDFPAGIQSFDYTEIYSKWPFDGGTIRGQGFPLIDYVAGSMQQFLQNVFCEMSTQWTEGQRPGYDTHVISDSDWELGLIPNGQPYTRASIGYEYQPGGAGMSNKPFGNNNSFEDGYRVWSLVSEWTNDVDPQNCSFRAPGAQWASVTGGSFIDLYLQKKPLALWYDGGGGRLALFVMMPPNDYTRYEFLLGSLVFQPPAIELPPNCYSAFLINNNTTPTP